MNLLGCGIGGFLTYCIMAQHVGKNIAKKICTNSHHFDCNIEYRLGGIIDLADMCAAYFATFFSLIVFLNFQHYLQLYFGHQQYLLLPGVCGHKSSW